MTGKPLFIPATYGGVKFRSRTEARWAVFFDELKLEWHYEHEGYDLPSGWYLPDFYLPSLDCCLEIKGRGADKKAHGRCAELADTTARPVYLFVGSPGEQENDPDGDWYESDSAYLYLPDGGGDIHYMWCSCPGCGKFGIQFDGRGARICGSRCIDENGRTRITGKHIGHADKGYSFDDPRIVAAAEKARATRFH